MSLAGAYPDQSALWPVEVMYASLACLCAAVQLATGRDGGRLAPAAVREGRRMMGPLEPERDLLESTLPL